MAMRYPTSPIPDTPLPPHQRQFEFLAGAGQQSKVGQLGNTTRNALGKLVQSRNGRLGKHGRPPAGLRQQRTDELARIGRLPRLNVDS